MVFGDVVLVVQTRFFYSRLGSGLGKQEHSVSVQRGMARKL
jgi:hypothetical protein